MPSTPFDTAHQDSLRMLIGKVLPDAGTHLTAEAVAAGYGFATHEAFGAAIRAVEAGQPARAPDFDAARLIGRLHALGEPVGEQDEALRFLPRVMADSPRSSPPDEAQARRCLRSPGQTSCGQPARSLARPRQPERNHNVARHLYINV